MMAVLFWLLSVDVDVDGDVSDGVKATGRWVGVWMKDGVASGREVDAT